MTIAMLALAGFPATGGLLRQDLPDRRGGRQRLRLARRRDRARLGDLARLLPARGRRGVDALARRRPSRRPRSRPGRRSRAARRRLRTRTPTRPRRAGAAGGRGGHGRRRRRCGACPARGGVRRGGHARRRRSSSASSRGRCSIWRARPAPRSRTWSKDSGADPAKCSRPSPGVSTSWTGPLPLSPTAPAVTEPAAEASSTSCTRFWFCGTWSIPNFREQDPQWVLTGVDP